MIATFWREQPAAYRNFQMVFTLLSLNFLIPAATYSFAPEVAIEQFLLVNKILGGEPYLFDEASSRVWRYLGAANVMTLGLMCVLLQLNLRTFFPVLVPLTFMKMYAAVSWLVGWWYDPGARFFLAAAILDFVTSAAFVYFAGTARRAIAEVDDRELVPSPVSVPLPSIDK